MSETSHKPRWYQVEAVKALFDFIANKEGNPLIVLPTGAGKGFIMGEIARQMDEWGARLLILAHVKELVEQNAKQAGRIIGDSKVGVYSAGIGRREFDAMVTSAGIQSIYNKAFDLKAVDLILLDECHRLSDDSDSMYQKFITDMRLINPNVRLAGLTATPFRMKTGHLCEEGGLFSEVAYEVGVKALMVQGFLSKVTSKSTKMNLDFNGLHVRAGEFVDEEVMAIMDAKKTVETAVEEIVAHAHDRKGVVIFCVSVEHSKHVAALLRDKNVGEVAEVYGEVGNVERDMIIDRFKKKEIKFLTNVNCLTTGFDAPHVDLIALMRPTKSAGLYLQCVGRGLRIADGKLDCKILDFGRNIERHGPIDLATQGHMGNKKSGEVGVAPTKICPECDEVILATYRKCPACNYEFISQEKPPHDAQAYSGSILSAPKKPIEVEIIRTSYQIHVSKAENEMMMVTYWMSLNENVRDFVCLSHPKGSFPRKNGEKWWASRCMMDVPDNSEQAVHMAHDGALAPTLKIKYFEADEKNKYPKIIGYELGDIPEYYAGMNRKKTWEDYDLKEDGIGDPF